VLRIVPLTLKQANDLVASLHRHHKPALSHRFSIGVEETVKCPECYGWDNIIDPACEKCSGSGWASRITGAAIIGRPVARGCDPYNVAEVTRLVTDGTKNACSILYAAAARIAREMGFTKIQTYILEDEPGTSLLAAAWSFESKTAGGDWNVGAQKRTGRGIGPRRTDQPQNPKQRWAKILNEERKAA